MPRYEYYCEANRRTVEVEHAAGTTLRTWGELCYASGHALGRTRPGAAVRRILRRAPAVSAEPGNSELRSLGFTKLVKRDQGVYENVTAGHGEARYMRRGRKDTIPHLRKKMRD